MARTRPAGEEGVVVVAECGLPRLWVCCSGDFPVMFQRITYSSASWSDRRRRPACCLLIDVVLCVPIDVTHGECRRQAPLLCERFGGGPRPAERPDICSTTSFQSIRTATEARAPQRRRREGPAGPGDSPSSYSATLLVAGHRRAPRPAPHRVLGVPCTHRAVARPVPGRPRRAAVVDDQPGQSQPRHAARRGPGIGGSSAAQHLVRRRLGRPQLGAHQLEPAALAAALPEHGRADAAQAHADPAEQREQVGRQPGGQPGPASVLRPAQSAASTSAMRLSRPPDRGPRWLRRRTSARGTRPRRLHHLQLEVEVGLPPGYVSIRRWKALQLRG